MIVVSKEVCDKVFALVKKIPKGKVATYGTIGNNLHLSPRIVGNALHRNNSSEVPCHRVVNREGRVAPSFAFRGPQIQRERLEKEGVTFTDDMHVDIKKHLYTFPDLKNK